MTGDLFMTFKKEGEKTRKKQEEFMMALLLHLEAIPAMTEGKKRKKKKTRQLQIGVEKPPVLSELCSLFICHGGPDSHECTAQQQAAKKIIKS